MPLPPRHKYHEPSYQLMSSCIYPGCGLPEDHSIHDEAPVLTPDDVPVVSINQIRDWYEMLSHGNLDDHYRVLAQMEGIVNA